MERGFFVCAGTNPCVPAVWAARNVWAAPRRGGLACNYSSLFAFIHSKRTKNENQADVNSVIKKTAMGRLKYEKYPENPVYPC
jgi:hypothetical protein